MAQWIEHLTSNQRVAGSSPARCTTRTTPMARDNHSQRNYITCIVKSGRFDSRRNKLGEIVFVSPNQTKKAIVGSQRKSETYEGI